jgi:hypothetical protein
MPEIIYLLPSFIYLFYLVCQEPEESIAMIRLKKIVKAEEARLECLKCRNSFLKMESTRLEQLAGYLN